LWAEENRGTADRSLRHHDDDDDICFNCFRSPPACSLSSGCFFSSFSFYFFYLFVSVSSFLFPFLFLAYFSAPAGTLTVTPCGHKLLVATLVIS
jgi:hypothetical protein